MLAPERDPLAALVCPDDHGALERRDGTLHCRVCARDYTITRDIPDFVAGGPARTRRWEAAQRYELEFWSEPDRGASAAHDHARFAAAAAALTTELDTHLGTRWRARVAHVGPAAHGEIHHLPATERYAVEPLAPALDALGLLDRRDVQWVAAMGERLPFADGWLTAALIPNVIDHVAQPARVLAELHRCLGPGAPLWLSSHVAHPLWRAPLAVLARTRLGYFAGHPWTFTAAALREMIEGAGFRVLSEHEGPAVGADERVGLRGAVKRRLLGAHYCLAVAR